MNQTAILAANIATNLAYYRAERGMSQRQLAAAAQTTQVTVNNIENERANPRVSTLTKLADALQIETAQLLQSKTETLKS